MENAAGLGAIANAYFVGTPSIRTFTISLASAADDVLATIAQQGGGKTYQTVGVTAQIESALADIRDSSACTFDIPVPAAGTIVPGAVSVGHLGPGATAPTPLSNVYDAAACTDDGYYFDSELSPSTVTLCPVACADLRADIGAKLRVSVDDCD